jgi:hypothetical protein
VLLGEPRSCCSDNQFKTPLRYSSCYPISAQIQVFVTLTSSSISQLLMAEKGHDGWKTLGVKLKEGSPFISQIAVRRPAVKDLTEEQAERTVYLAGLPLGVHDEIVQNICTCFGGVDQVALHQSKVSRHCCCDNRMPLWHTVAAPRIQCSRYRIQCMCMCMCMCMALCVCNPDVCRFMPLAVVVMMPGVFLDQRR